MGIIKNKNKFMGMRMLNIANRIFIVLLFSAGVVSGEDSMFNAKPMRECINSDEDHFKKKTPFFVDRSTWDFSFVDRLDTPPPPSVEEWQDAMRVLTWDLLFGATDSVDVEFLIAALQSHDNYIVNFAVKRLLYHVGHASREPYAERIKDIVGSCPESLEAKWLVAKCGLDGKEKEKILQSKDGNDLLLQALCGDTMAEQKIIENFRHAKDLLEMYRWIRPLALIGSKSCSQTLVDGIAVRKFGETTADSSRAQRTILRALALVYEEQSELFSYLYWNGGFQKNDELDQWIRDEFGHSVWTNDDFVIESPDYIFPPYPRCTCTNRSDISESSLALNKAPKDRVLFVPREGEPWDVVLESATNEDHAAKIEFVPIPAGSFWMGSYDYDINEAPEHRVSFDQSFWMARTEITRDQYRLVMAIQPEAESDIKQGADNPIIVSRSDAYAFCRALTERERKAGRLSQGYEYTLPSEAQWEYACLAGSRDDVVLNLVDFAWTGSLHPVGLKQPNNWGLYDMLGNVAEWCSDCYHPTYWGAPADGSAWGGRSGCEAFGITRGGTFAANDNWYCQPTRRNSEIPQDRNGFRPVLKPAANNGRPHSSELNE